MFLAAAVSASLNLPAAQFQESPSHLSNLFYCVSDSIRFPPLPPRDHGVPGYIRYREICQVGGGRKVRKFSDLGSNISREVRTRKTKHIDCILFLLFLLFLVMRCCSCCCYWLCCYCCCCFCCCCCCCYGFLRNTIRASFCSEMPNFFISISQKISRLRRVYKSVEDIDLFVGLYLEDPGFNGALVGQTFLCLIGDQVSLMQTLHRH